MKSRRKKLSVTICNLSTPIGIEGRLLTVGAWTRLFLVTQFDSSQPKFKNADSCSKSFGARAGWLTLSRSVASPIFSTLLSVFPVAEY